MGILPLVFLTLVVSAIALLLAVVILPAYLRLRIEAGANQRFSAELRLLGGVAPPIRMSLDSGSPKKGATVSGATKDNGGSKRSRFNLNGERRDRIYRIITGLPRFIARLIGSLHVDEVLVDADVGLGDPAETGQFFGWLSPLLYGSNTGRIRLALRPDFTQARVSGHAAIQLHAIPAALGWHVMQFAWVIFRPRFA